jgi:hypothetical protein
MRPRNPHLLHPHQAGAVVLHIADNGLAPTVPGGWGQIDFFFVQRVLLIEINGVRPGLCRTEEKVE